MQAVPFVYALHCPTAWQYELELISQLHTDLLHNGCTKFLIIFTSPQTLYAIMNEVKIWGFSVAIQPM